MQIVNESMIYKEIDRLLSYGIITGLVEKEDLIYTRNRLLELLELEDYHETGETIQDIGELEEILYYINRFAFEKKIITDNSISRRDLFDTAVMSILVPRPSEVIRTFRNHYVVNCELATQYFYKLSQDTDYIRRYRIKNDQKWKTATAYGELDITINLSKPEKDPKEIAAAKKVKSSSYPKCLLCVENEGFAGTMKHPARQNHRIVPIEILNEKWGLQYSPYVYYNEHCIVINHNHIPMQINTDTFRKLLDFVRQFPHYFVGSNADLPIVGGSILSHDHFQGGNYEFPMAKALMEETFTVKGFEEIEVGIVKWPISVIRLRAVNAERLIELAAYILEKWKNYSDESVFIYAYTGEEPHNTITPIARKREGYYELDLALRNNITTKEHPCGVYHPHENLHHIKKENIGLIEVMGLAILPSRLEQEIEQLSKAILSGDSIQSNEKIAKHAEWVNEFLPRHKTIDQDTISQILREEIGHVFRCVLEDAGVFKRDAEGKQAFVRFLEYLSI